MRYHENISSNNPFPEQWNDWRNCLRHAGGGIVIDGGVHWLRPLRRLVGEIGSVCSLNTTQLKKMQGESLSHTLIKFQNGTVGTLDCLVSPGPLSEHPFFTLIGNKGEIKIDGKFGGGIQFLNNQNKNLNLKSTGGYFGAFAPHLEEFINCVLNKKAMTSSARDAYIDVKIVEAIYESQERQGWVDIQYPLG